VLYERFFNGDVVRLRQTRYQTYDYSWAVGMVDRFLQRVTEGPAAVAPSPDPSPAAQERGA
jgi:aromatic ring hydroxylase